MPSSNPSTLTAILLAGYSQPPAHLSPRQIASIPAPQARQKKTAIVGQSLIVKSHAERHACKQGAVAQISRDVLSCQAGG